MQAKTIVAELIGRDYLEVKIFTDGRPDEWRLIACAETLQKVNEFRKQYGQLLNWPDPQTHSHSDILIRELIAKAKGHFKLPYEHEEICHCRAVPTLRVDQAIVAGCKTPEQVSRMTSASTACGTCRADVQSLLSYRRTAS